MTDGKKKHRTTVDYSVLVQGALALGVSESRVAEIIGYTASAATHWREAKAIPAVVSFAVEALIKRKSPNGADGPKLSFILLTLDGTSLVDFQTIVKPDEIVIKGQRLWLVPAPKA